MWNPLKICKNFVFLKSGGYGRMVSTEMLFNNKNGNEGKEVSTR